MQAASPIKLGEYLLCGLPVLATADIGDTDAVTTDVCYLLRSMDEADLKTAAEWFTNTVLPNRAAYRVNSRTLGLKWFSLESSIDAYAKALDSLEVL
jgi:hypothetical protein